MRETPKTSLSMRTGIAYALLAALLFGASTPLAKLLVGDTPPVLLAGLLYAGSGFGLCTWLAARALLSRGMKTEAPLSAADLPWLAGAVLSGGILGPVFLMTGLSITAASTASLLLNLEGVLTAILAWSVFREQFDCRIFTGMLLIIAGSVVLSMSPAEGSGGTGISWGALCIVAACLCWAIDNNLTRKVSSSDAVQIAAIKGVAASSVNLTFALGWLGVTLPGASKLVMTGLVGFCGYGLSLVLFVLALRHLGTARTGAYFSAAPFIGAALSLAMPGEQSSVAFWIAAVMMLVGIWMHVTESHDHMHMHEYMLHAHPHYHDAHHRHTHDFPWDGKEPHVHPHEHEPLTHAHPHFPDIHHRHKH
jgi:drug/metabolite transporter (DMT)-like permease